MFEINAVDMVPITFTPTSEVQGEATIINSILSDAADYDGPRALLDTGTFASCTDQLQLLHNYVAFGPKNPSPIRLMPATENSDATPKGVGYLHVPSPTAPGGFLAIRTFYHPALRTTAIDERDFVKAMDAKKEDYTGETMHKSHEACTFTYQCHHRLCRVQDIVVEGILVQDKAYTMPLIPPITGQTLSPIQTLIDSDPEFADDCKQATIQNIYAYQELQYESLREG